MGQLAAWETIEKNKGIFSEKIMLKDYPYTGKAKEKYLQDAVYNLTFLSSALSFNNLESYKKYMIWLAELMKSIGVPLDGMLSYFKAMDIVLFEELQEYNISNLRLFLNEGAEAFEKKYLEEESLENREIHTPEVDHFLQLILNFKREEAARYIIDLLEKGEDIKKIYLNIFQPALYQVGLLWQSQKISVAKEHYATSVVQSIIGMMYPYLFKNQRKNGKVFVGACSGSELHEIGLRMVADFLELEGWDTHYLGANIPIEYVIQEVVEKKPVSLGISTTIMVNLPFTRELIKVIKSNPQTSKTKIIVGGRVYRENEILWKEVKADAYAADALSAVKTAEKLSLGKGK